MLPDAKALEQRFQRALDRLAAWVSNGSTAQLDGRSSPHPEDRILFRRREDADDDPQTWLRLWHRCRRRGEREQLVDDLERYLTLRLHGSKRNQRRGTLEWKQAIARDPRTPSEVAIIYGVSRTTVYAYRREHGTS